MSILVCCQQGHPSAIFQGWWPPDNIEVAGQRSEVYVEGTLPPEHLRLLGATRAGRVCGRNMETMRKTNDETDGEPSTEQLHVPSAKKQPCGARETVAQAGCHRRPLENLWAST